MIFLSRIFICATALVGVFGSLTGCSMLKKPKTASEADGAIPARVGNRPHQVGTVTLVNPAEKFVLIDTGASAVPAIGTALRTFSGETASGIVTVGRVTHRPWVVADIVQGSPTKGDAVFQ